MVILTLTLSRVQRINNNTHGGADCGVATIIVVDVQMDLGGGGGGAGHEQTSGHGNVSEPHDARCVAVECVCVVDTVVKLIVCLLWLFVQVYQSNTMLLVVVVVVQYWTCCKSGTKNSTYCRNTAYCDGCNYEAGKHYSDCQRSKKN